MNYVKCGWWMLVAAMMLAPDPRTAAQEKQGQGQSKDLPSAETVINGFVKAMGGESAFEKISSQKATGTFSMPSQGFEGQMEIFTAQPSKLLIHINLPSIGKMSTGYNGEVAWMSNPATGPMLLEGAMAEQIAAEADFDSVLHKPGNYKSMEVTGITDFAGHRAYELAIVKKNGKEQKEYFDAETYLWRGFVGAQDTPFGSVTVTNVFDEYKQFGSIKVPTQITQDLGAVKQVMTLNEVKFNSVDESVFELPAQIKALLEKE